MGKAKAVGSALEHVFSGSKLNELKNMSIDDLKEIKGIGDKKAQHIYDTVQGMGGEGAKVNGKTLSLNKNSSAELDKALNGRVEMRKTQMEAGNTRQHPEYENDPSMHEESIRNEANREDLKNVGGPEAANNYEESIRNDPRFKNASSVKQVEEEEKERITQKINKENPGGLGQENVSHFGEKEQAKIDKENSWTTKQERETEQQKSDSAKTAAADEEADMRADPKIQQALRDRQHQDNIDSKDTWFGKKKAWAENKIDDLKDHEQPLNSTQRRTNEQLGKADLGKRTDHVDFMDSKAAHSQRVFDETSNMMEQMKGLKSKEELGEFYKSHGKEGFTGTADEFVKDYHKEQMGKGPSIGDRVQAWHGKQALGVGVIGMGAIKAFDNGGQRSNAQLYGG